MLIFQSYKFEYILRKISQYKIEITNVIEFF